MPQDLPEPELSGNARIVLEKRYLKKDEQGQPLEDARQMFWRVASKIASAEDNYPASVYTPQELAREFYSLMTSFDFLPNSPTLMNAGTDLEQLAACFVLPVQDSMQGIFDAIKYAALIHKSGGGTGFSFSRLRPSKSKVGSTGGVASGPVSFLRIFNTATEQVKQGGTRRGANMGVLRVDHPDILEFIKAKERQGQLNNFNLSVALDEKFMQAVEQDREYSLIAPHTGQEKGRLQAREVFTLLVQKAWEGGDPGIIFIDRINRDNPTPAQGEIESTNPCVTADTFVCTSKGPRQVQDLLDRQFTAMVQGQLYPSREQGFFYTGRKPILALRTQEGYQVKLTWEHPVCRAASVHRSQVRTEWIKAGELEPGDRILLGNQGLSQAWPGKYGRNEGYLMGLLLGDGVLKEDKAVVSVWTRCDSVNGSSQEDSQVMRTALECARNMPHRRDFQGWQKIEGRQEQRLCLASLKAVCLDLGLTPGNKRITPKLEKCSSEFCSAFLSGLFDADGSVQGTAEKGFSVRLAQSDLQTLQAVQRMLLRLGIKSVIHRERRQAGTSQLPDGRGGQQDYAIRAQHELVISRENLQAFQEHIGFQDQDKAGRLQAFLKSYTRGSYRERFLAIVESLEQLGEEDVYDVQIPEANAFCANGLLLHNCGEQPLLPYEACNLGSLNMARFYSPEARDGVNWDRLAERIRLCVRFLDNVIDCSRYPLQQIQDKVHQNRKIGLGLMGWADLLFQLKIPYNSRKALDLGQTLMQFLQEQSWAASKELAEERGAFPGYEQSIFKQKEQGPFRNATTTTIAPTGTLSILAGCSSGIEPLFALSFVRQVLDGERLMELNPYFEQVLQESQYYSQQLMQDIAEKGSIRDMDFLPEELRQIFVTAMDIESRWHLEMQVAFQKFTDNAVSKTVNLPNSATQKDIYDIYWSAYELGCKGVTVYRDGSRQEQVLSTGQGQSQDQDRTKVKDRPEVLYGFTQKVSTGLGELYLTVNEVDGQPFEVFATIGRSGRSITAKAEAIGRLVSLALRSGIHVRDVVKQLKGIGGEHPVFQKKGLLLSIPDAVGWVLENRYLSNQKPQIDNHSLGSPKCPECGVALLFQEGCFLCQACGYTKCG
ncbi:MAG: ribonucleotide reductase N-terminal alpha domain-containing protein [Desulfohalobiaceae bacterium]